MPKLLKYATTFSLVGTMSVANSSDERMTCSVFEACELAGKCEKSSRDFELLFLDRGEENEKVLMMEGGNIHRLKLINEVRETSGELYGALIRRDFSISDGASQSTLSFFGDFRFTQSEVNASYHGYADPGWNGAISPARLEVKYELGECSWWSN